MSPYCNLRDYMSTNSTVVCILSFVSLVEGLEFVQEFIILSLHRLAMHFIVPI